MHGTRSPSAPNSDAGGAGATATAAAAHTAPSAVNGRRSPAAESAVADAEPPAQDKQQQHPQSNHGDTTPAAAARSRAGSVEIHDEPMVDAPSQGQDSKADADHAVPPPWEANGDTNNSEDTASEAETLIDSPVKKRKVEKQSAATAASKPDIPQPSQAQAKSQPQTRAPRHRIGSLPVPTDGDDDVDSSAVSPVPSTEMGGAKNGAASTPTTDQSFFEAGMRAHSPLTLDQYMARKKGSDRKGSESLSSVRSMSSVHSDLPSRASSRSRAASERPQYARPNSNGDAGGPSSPNPRKRKHRASSVSLPNKRPSGHALKQQRRLRGPHLDELGAGNNSKQMSEQSPSPSPQARRGNSHNHHHHHHHHHHHRRAVSTQSAFTDGAAEHHSHRQRRAATQGPGRDVKANKNGWDESDASSETTSHGAAEPRKAGATARGIGRSTSTPGRPAGREHKRHVNKYGFTRLAEACESGDLESVKEWRFKDPDQVELAEFAGNKPLQIAALNGNVEVVDYLIDQGCQIDCANVDKDTPLIDAAENGHIDVVRSLLKAGVDPLRQNLKGQQALDVVTDDIDDANEIRTELRKAIDQWNSDGAKQRREEEEEQRHRARPNKELHFMARSYENLLLLVQINDRTGVREFLDARVPVDNAIIAAAAKTGDLYLVNMLLAEMTEKKAYQKPEKPMLGVLGTSHFEMVKSLTELDQFNPLYRNRQGLSWPEIAEQRNGPQRRQEVELLQSLYDAHSGLKERRSSSPVSKRDSGKRRLAQAADDEDDDNDNNNSDDEGTPRRKQGRRLMSKKDMRAASGKVASESSSDDSGSDGGATGADASEEASMKPPRSPPAKRGPGRPRTKSISAQPSEASPKSQRRRSSSLRADQALATVEEKAEDKDTAKQAQDEDEERKKSLEAAQKLEAERQRAEESEAAAKKALEEEAARQAEEERKADEIRQREEERRAEEARKAEQERRRLEAEAIEAKRLHREAVAASLPSAVSHVLNPHSLFDYANDAARLFLIQHFTPLQVVRHEHPEPYASLNNQPDAPFWVVNVQAAPLLGHQGIELMIKPDSPGYKGSLAETWETKDVPSDEAGRIASMLASLPDCISQEAPTVDANGFQVLSFAEEVKRVAERASRFSGSKERIQASDAAVLRYVRLDDVLRHLHSTLRSVPIDVRFDYLLPPGTARRSGEKISTGFVERMGGLLGGRPRSRTYTDGNTMVATVLSALGSTPVTVTHAK